ncbi:MAG: hypothetical protein QE283_13300 [Rhodoferax sp.]|nr:hypothetical protein [Rhodoferax sp.]
MAPSTRCEIVFEGHFHLQAVRAAGLAVAQAMGAVLHFLSNVWCGFSLTTGRLITDSPWGGSTGAGGDLRHMSFALPTDLAVVTLKVVK